jgi:hypothetical protein
MPGKDKGGVEIDEMFTGGKVDYNMHRSKTAVVGRKTIVMTLADRSGDAVGVIVPLPRGRRYKHQQSQS